MNIRSSAVLLVTFLLCGTFSLSNAQVFTIPYSEDFDTGAPGWYSDSANAAPGTVWELGTPSFGTTNSTHSGTTCWDVNLSTSYANAAHCNLVSPAFDFSGIQAIRISFWHNSNVEVNWDGYVLQYTTDTVTNPWNVVGSINAPFSNNWYTDSIIGGPSFPCWSGNSGGWYFSSIVIPSPSTTQRVYFRFLFQSDASVVFDGVSVDDFSIEPVNMNIVSGTVYYDQNSNYTLDGGDTTLSGIVLHTVTPSADYYQVNDALGNYSVFADTGAQCNVTTVLPLYSSSQPPSYSITLVGSNQVSTGNDFLITFLPGIMDPTVQLNAGFLRPGLSHVQFITYSNQGTSPVSGAVVLQHSSHLSFNSSTDSSVVTGPDTREFTYATLLPGQTRHIVCWYFADSTMAIGDTAVSYVTILPLSGDTNTVNNYDTLISVATNSVDPNNKLAEPSGDIPLAAVNAGMDIEYTINFQNTGTAPALHVNIFDLINSNLDLSTFDLIGSSHPVTSWSIGPNRLLHITFAQINLPDSTSDEPGSQGQVTYRIRPLSGLQAGATISNTASIYFDNNLPVVTNTVTHLVVIPSSIPEIVEGFDLNVYPNPVSGQFSFAYPAGFDHWELMNVLGEQVRTGTLNMQPGIRTQDTGPLPAGMYLIRLTGPGSKFASEPVIVLK